MFGSIGKGKKFSLLVARISYCFSFKPATSFSGALKALPTGGRANHRSFSVFRLLSSALSVRLMTETNLVQGVSVPGIGTHCHLAMGIVTRRLCRPNDNRSSMAWEWCRMHVLFFVARDRDTAGKTNRQYNK